MLENKQLSNEDVIEEDSNIDLNIKRNVSDSLFRFIFDDPKHKEFALSLYNALNNTSYDDPNKIEINTLKDVVYINIKNDVSFIIGNELVLLEQQSTYNPNMPLRGLAYYLELISKDIKKHQLNVYSSHPIKLKRPQYIVFYNGKKEVKEIQRYYLSSLFEAANTKLDDKDVYDFTCKVYNLNSGYNKLLLDKCEALKAYAMFVNSYKEFKKQGYSRTKAVDKAISKCIDNDLLRDYFLQEQGRVKKMFLNQMSYEESIELIGKEYYEDGKLSGKQEGLLQGKQEGINEGINKNQQEVLKITIDSYKNGKISLEMALTFTKLDKDEFLKLVN